MGPYHSYPYYGPPPPGLMTSSFNKFWGVPPEPSDEANILMGNAGSSGKVRGTVKIVRSLAEGDKLEVGDILVAETTAPPVDTAFCDGRRYCHRHGRDPQPLRRGGARIPYPSRGRGGCGDDYPGGWADH
jgi:hypothetical protein